MRHPILAAACGVLAAAALVLLAAPALAARAATSFDLTREPRGLHGGYYTLIGGSSSSARIFKASMPGDPLHAITYHRYPRGE